MTKGKTICNALKVIRKQIADANDIHYEPRECNHQGECCGTCPACESEVRYIEKQLDIRRQLGKAVVVVGLSTGLFSMTGFSSCSGFGGRTVGMVEDTPPTHKEILKEDTLKKSELMEELDGYMAEPDSDETECPEEESSANNDSKEK
jgi:hypothetical protein